MPGSDGSRSQIGASRFPGAVQDPNHGQGAVFAPVDQVQLQREPDAGDGVLAVAVEVELQQFVANLLDHDAAARGDVHLDGVAGVHDLGCTRAVVKLDRRLRAGLRSCEIDRRLCGATGTGGERRIERAPVRGADVAVVSPSGVGDIRAPQRADADEAGEQDSGSQHNGHEYAGDGLPEFPQSGRSPGAP